MVEYVLAVRSLLVREAFGLWMSSFERMTFKLLLLSDEAIAFQSMI
jgi:hypothetical protein